MLSYNKVACKGRPFAEKKTVDANQGSSLFWIYFVVNHYRTKSVLGDINHLTRLRIIISNFC